MFPRIIGNIKYYRSISQLLSQILWQRGGCSNRYTITPPSNWSVFTQSWNR